MKKNIRLYLKSLICAALLLLMHTSSYASHIIGAELRYKWVSGLTYEVTMYLYGDCSVSSGAFRGLPISSPQICIYDGNTAMGSINLTVQAPICGTEVTPVCPDSLAYTTCTNPTFPIFGIKKFIYTGTVTLAHDSHYWRFIYNSNNGSSGGSYSCSFYTGFYGGSSSGRTSAITNIASAGTTSIQLIDTLNTLFSRGHNSSPVLTVEPTPYFCQGSNDCYNPGAVDLYDTSVLYHEPSGDSLVFSLIAATNGNAATCIVGGPVTYIGMAWAGQPVSGATPLTVAAASDFSFDPVTGQLCFIPSITQRSTVVYNVREFFRDTLVGTLQREMNFNIIPCTVTAPSGNIDSFSAGSLADTTDGNHFVACQYSGMFNLNFDPRETDTSLHIIVTATGLATGFVFTVTNNNTNHPHGVLSGNTATILPGTYTFYLTYEDNHCPLTGKATVAFTVTINPVPNIRDSVVSKATCAQKEALYLIPGGYGKPWTIKVSDAIGDTLQVFTDTTAILDSLTPGIYHLTIFTVVGSVCHVDDTIHVDTAKITAPVTFTDPTFCGGADGTIVLHSLNPSDVDTMFYDFNGVLQPTRGFVVTADGTDTVTGLLAGAYTNIRVKSGLCYSDPEVATLNNPPFTFRAITKTNPTKCGFCDGTDTLYGIHPGQLDTITYNLGGVLSTNTNFIATDSMVVFTGLCAGTYSNFTVKTAGVCSATIAGPITLDSQRIAPAFSFTPVYGCKGDTVLFTNGSTPASDLTYHWDFGDGYTDTATNPRHFYLNTHNATYNVNLIITNTKCVDSVPHSILLDNYLKAGFAMTPPLYVCQNNPVTFTDTSVGASPVGLPPLAYNWSFGDGTTDNQFNETHSYPNSGKYTIRLIESNGVPCYDTAYGTINVDSAGPVSIAVTDSVLCRGQGITFNGIYTSSGFTGITWTFGDGSIVKNVNPVFHAFDATGGLTVSADATYRACPEVATSRTIRVFPGPDLYLGPDLSMCPNSQPIILSDDRNIAYSTSKWRWSTGDTSSSIIVSKPGTYTLIVTVDGCTASDTVVVKNDCYISVPNIFSPNGDGLNDYFFPRQVLSAGVTDFKMVIYNRWGQEVYETSNIDGRGWDGSFNNTQQAEGVYIYVIDAKFKDGQVEHHQGNVTLIR